MRITRVAAQNFLSFESLDIADLDPRLTAVVGPNGSGKSNLVRLLSVVRGAAGWPSDSTLLPEELVPLRRLGANKGFSLAVDLELTEDRERALVGDFLQAAFLSSDWPSSYTADFPAKWKEWIQTAFQAAPAFLFSGTLKVALPDRSDGGLDVAYECEAEGTGLVWSASKGMGKPSATSSGLNPLEAFRHATEAGSAPEGLTGFFGRGDRITLEVRPDRLGDAPELLQRLGDLTGEEFNRGGSRFYTGAWVFHHLLRQGLYLTDNIRVPPCLAWAARDLIRSPQSLNLSDGKELPLYLFRLKSGDAEQRESYRKICKHFLQLTGWPLDVTFGPKPPSARVASAAARGIGLPQTAAVPSLGQGPEEGEYILLPVVRSSSGDVPIEFAGAGAWEAAILSVFLEMPGGVLVLDEPALNLHPIRQRQLLEMLSSQDRQVLLITHSPYMVPVDEPADLGRIIRFVLEAGTTCVYRAQHGPSAGREQTKWLRWLSELADVRSFLFARGVVLVEGGTEQGALSSWFAKSPEAKRLGTPDDLNISIFSVGGDQKFQTFISLLSAFEIPWVVVCDGRVYREREENGQRKVSIFQQLLGAGIQLEGVSLEGISEFADAIDKGATNGVFTLAGDFTQEFEDYVESRLPQEFAEAVEEWPKSKVLAGRTVADETDCPKEVAELYALVLERLNLT